MSVPVVSRDAELLRALIERIDQKDPHAFNNLGVLYHSKGLHAEAADAFLRAIDLDPRMQMAVRNLELAAADGACDSRLASLAGILAANPDDRVAAREQARLFRLIGRLAEAAQKLDALIAEDPDDAPALLERGLLEQRVGDLRKAQRWFERASNADEDNTLSRLHLAEVLYQRGQNEQALSVLDTLIALDGTIADAHLLRGFVLGDMGRHEAGMEAARRAAQLNPARSTAQANLSIERGLGSGSYPVVELPSVTAAASGGDASNALPRYSLGLAFRQRGYFSESRREFERALDEQEDEQLVRHALAELDLVDGKHESAASGYETLLHVYGERARWRNEHGVAMHQGGQIELAAESYRRALRCDPRHAMAYGNLGVALAELGEQAAAREALQQAASIDPTFVEARLNLARWHANQRDPLAALSLLRELSAFHATNADVWYEMGSALLALHRPEDAQRSFELALENRSGFPEAEQALAQMTSVFGDVAGDSLGLTAPMVRPAIRPHSRLTISIELQHECPDAVGPINLLALRAVAPVAEFVTGDTAQQQQVPDVAVNVSELLDEADALAAAALHRNALTLYAQARIACERNGARQFWRRAAMGQARSLCLTGKGTDALDLLEKLSHQDRAAADDDAETLALLAAAHTAAWKITAAEPRFARAAIARFLRLEPRSAALLHFVGDVALTLKEDALAMVLFRRALAVDPMRPTPRVAIARLLRLRNDMLAARLELVAALAVAPLLREALLEMARLHCSNGRPADALSILVAHLNRAPADVDALTLLAEALKHAGRSSDAKLALARALRYAPEHPEARQLEASFLQSPEHETNVPLAMAV